MFLVDKISFDLNEDIASSRQIAIELGYDYISTLHLFFADCESKRSDSILNYCFKDENEYQDFKKFYELKENEKKSLLTEDIPLTKEAEQTFYESEKERQLQGHNMIFPSHFFIAALKNDNSLLFECFKSDNDALEKLKNYYTELDKNNQDLNSDKTSNEIENNNQRSLLKYFLGLFKWTN